MCDSDIFRMLTFAISNEDDNSSKKKKTRNSDPKTSVCSSNNNSLNETNNSKEHSIFDEFKLKQFLLHNIEKCGYKTPTPVQNEVIPLMLKRRNVFAIAPTGSGKTASFVIPIIEYLNVTETGGFRAVIIVPTKELVKQIQNECLQLIGNRKLKVHVMEKINKSILKFTSKNSQKLDILISTPYRLCLFLKNEAASKCLDNVKWLVIDEVDKLFEDGEFGFKTQMKEIIMSCKSKDLKIAVFSATFLKSVFNWCNGNMKNIARVSVGERNTAVSTVHQELVFAGNDSGKLIAIQNLLRQGLSPPILIFVHSKVRAQQLYKELFFEECTICVIHADQTQQQRENTIRSFREGKVSVLICTELLARGIDFKTVNVVINYDIPNSTINYIHRVGRAGRAGRTGKAITYFTIDDRPVVRKIAEVIHKSGFPVPDYLLKLKHAKNSNKRYS